MLSQIANLDIFEEQTQSELTSDLIELQYFETGSVESLQFWCYTHEVGSYNLEWAMFWVLPSPGAVRLGGIVDTQPQQHMFHVSIMSV